MREGTESPLFHLGMLNKVKNKISQVLDTILADGDHFVVDVKISSDLRKIGIALDGDRGVDIDYCAEVSRKLGAELESLEELVAFVLEVSSPGADAPLKFLRQYPKHIGRELKIRKNDGSELKAELLEVVGSMLQLRYSHKEKGKKAELRTLSMPFDNIEYAKVIISFK